MTIFQWPPIRARLEIEESRERIFALNGYRCEICRGPVRQYGTAQLAHRIAATKDNIAKYGIEVIHHPLNLAPVCQLRCNDAVMKKIKGRIELELVEKIREAIRNQHAES